MWPKLIGVCGCALAVFFAAFFYCELIGWRATQEKCEEVGNVRFGIQIQGVVDDFKEQFGRYPTPDELTNLLVMTIDEQPLTLTSKFDNSGCWCYDKKSGEVRINSHRVYDVGFASRIDLFNTHFRRPTKVDVVGSGRVETMDYTRLNDMVDLEKPQINQIITNWYATNYWR